MMHDATIPFADDTDDDSEQFKRLLKTKPL
jgi:hypothetical protein